MTRFISGHGCATALGLILASGAPALAQTYTITDTTVLETLVVQAASEELLQALGVSVVTEEQLENTPVANDISEIVRKQPGVNLTSNTSSGQRGNQRQIDIRGMGPENTLILIDGKPVLSRNSVRFGRSGERDTRGDSNWVPASAIEKIEIIRGPAAARYGSGAAGGVINIITKRPTETTVDVSVFAEVPENSKEGGTRRAGVVIGGPINDIFSYRLTANLAQTDADSPDINDDATSTEGVVDSPAGNEGVINRDIAGLWSADLDSENTVDVELSWSRQSNIYAGDTQLSNMSGTNTIINSLVDSGAETNRMTRTAASVTHKGDYDFGEAESFLQWEWTNNHRLEEGLSGGGEGTINSSTDYIDTDLHNITAKSEWDIPMQLVWDQTMTFGAEYRGEFMMDPGSITTALNVVGGGSVLGTASDPNDRDPFIWANLGAIYWEDNIAMTDQLTVTPGLRADVHSNFGFNLSPSLNASYELNENFTIKGGIARAYKSPNLYQLNPNYVYSSRGNGCYPGTGPCRILGNPDLEPEISLNKEIGISYQDDDGWLASLTFYHNDYQNRIATGSAVYATYTGPCSGRGCTGTSQYSVQRWENVGPAVVSGLEGNLTVPVLDNLTWTTNFTKIIESVDKDTGNPLSLVPEYTINTSLRYEPWEELGLTLAATHYGRIKPRIVNPYTTDVATGADLEERDPYTIVDFGFDYQLNDNLKVAGGVNNLFNFSLQRTGNGANTYNEAGRSYYLSLNGSF